MASTDLIELLVAHADAMIREAPAARSLSATFELLFIVSSTVNCLALVSHGHDECGGELSKFKIRISPNLVCLLLKSMKPTASEQGLCS